MPVFEIGAPMGLEQQLGIPGDLGRGAPDEPGRVLIDGGREGDFHSVHSPR